MNMYCAVSVVSVAVAVVVVFAVGSSPAVVAAQSSRGQDAGNYLLPSQQRPNGEVMTSVLHPLVDDNGHNNCAVQCAGLTRPVNHPAAANGAQEDDYLGADDEGSFSWLLQQCLHNRTTCPGGNDVPVNCWNTSAITNMDNAFGGGAYEDYMDDYYYNEEVDEEHAITVFNEPLDCWDTAQVTTMRHLFASVASFNHDINGWNTARVMSMLNMFRSSFSFNQDINGWDTSQVTSMLSMFNSATSFNHDINGWDTSHVRDMAYMFHGHSLFRHSQLRVASSFNQKLEDWNTSQVTDLQFMFRSASVFNQNLDRWDTAQVTNLNYMFDNAASFHQTLDGWNTSRVQWMGEIFSGASGMTVCPTWAVGKITSGPCEKQRVGTSMPDILLTVTSLLAIVTIMVVLYLHSQSKCTTDQGAATRFDH